MQRRLNNQCFSGHDQARKLLDAPADDTLKGVRDRAILATLVYCRRKLQRREELGAPARSHLGRARPQSSRMRRAQMPGAKPGRAKEPPRTGELGLKCKAGSQLRQWRGGRRWAG